MEDRAGFVWMIVAAVAAWKVVGRDERESSVGVGAKVVAIASHVANGFLTWSNHGRKEHE